MGSVITSATSLYVTPLKDVEDHRQYGAKAVRLASMLRLNFQVPSAVVITTDCFQAMLAENGLNEFIDIQRRGLSADEPKSTARAASEIQASFMNAEFPVRIREAIILATSPLLELGTVVVRSSACGEDSGTSAFAGQLDSILDVRTVEEMLDAVKRCWASYWSHRSLAYQLARNVNLEGMGVIVQPQVDARFAGVLFTQSLHQRRSGEMLVEYCRGMGEALVSGDVSPIRLSISKSGWRFDMAAMPEEPDATIDDAHIGQLAEVGHALEKHFQHPQDIEWAVDWDGKLHLVQSRPITTIEARPTTTIWSNANVNENFPEPITPLLYSIASTGYYHYFRNLGIAFGISMERIDFMEYPLRNIVGTHGGRLYYNLTNIHAVLRAAPCGEFLASAFNQFVGADATATDVTMPQWRSWRKGRVSEFFQMVRIVRCGWGRLRGMEKRIAVFERTIDAFAADSHPGTLPARSWNELLGLWRRFMQIRCQWTDAAMADAASMISYGLSQRWFAGEFTDEVDQAVANRLLTGLCNIVSGLPTEHLWNLSRKMRQHDSLVQNLNVLPADEVWNQIETDERYQEVRSEIHDFLEQWGFRCSGELMLTTPSYQEQPALLLDLLRTYIRLEGESPQELLVRHQQIREQETERILQVLKSRRWKWYLPWPRKDFIAKRLIQWTQSSVACRERARLKQALLYSRIRRLALTVGQAFVNKGFLKRVDDVFFLTYEEIQSVLAGSYLLTQDLNHIAMLRRTSHEQLNSEEAPPGWIELEPGESWTCRGEQEHGVESAPGRLFRGTGVCGGSIVGKAVVLTDSSQFDQVTSGDILVTRQTDPGWGPILFLVRGLVMERGGMLSHGAILAREYGIPSVVDVANATRLIVTGNRIRVDGDRGIVEILDE
ncbi:MAG: PEP/pyruvate-binding domain-containing protein [Planctomycetota bacterium]